MGDPKDVVLLGGPSAGETFQVRPTCYEFKVPIDTWGTLATAGSAEEVEKPTHLYRSTRDRHGRYEVFVWLPEKSSTPIRP